MSEKIKNYNLLEAELTKMAHLRNVAMIAHWDMATGIPAGSAASRGQEMATFAAVLHDMSTSKELEKLIKEASKEKQGLDNWQKMNLKLIKEGYEKQTCLTAQVQHEFSIASSESELYWRKARAENNFKSFIPYLDRVFNIVRKAANMQAQKLGKSSVDVLIDSFDPGRSAEEITKVFDRLKNELPKLISKITAKQSTEKFIPLSKEIDESTQRAIGLKVMEKMGFNMQQGRLDKSVHPFCTGSNDDVRITTRYDLKNFLSSLFGVIHETGHGLYQQNLPANYRTQSVGGALGMAFHESQSLIMEMQAGTSKSFISFLAKLLRDEFSFAGPEYSEENLYKLVTRVKPSFIRVDADEVTYPLHIILRFEIEKEILQDGFKAKDLPKLWNEKMKEYLGIVPDTDKDGCMQDIHWPSGWLGYFPSYTNGAIIASMLMKAAKANSKQIDSELGQGNFSSLNNYLNSKLRSLGSSKESADLLENATGHRTIEPDIFLEYLKNKYL